MEFSPRGQVLIIAQAGKLFDKAKIMWVEETGDGRVLYVLSVMRTEDRRYKIGEVRDETWQVLNGDPLDDVKSLTEAKMRYTSGQPTLTLEFA